MNIEEFNRLLKVNYAPYYALLSFEPSLLFDYFKCSPVTVMRNVKSGSIEKQQVVRVSTEFQERTYKSLCNLKTIYPFTVGLSSLPNDALALETAACINYLLLKKFPYLEWKWISSNIGKTKLEHIIDQNPQLIILYNVIPDSSRTYIIRDILCSFPKALKLVVVGGVHAIDYFDNYLHYPISGLIHLTGAKQTTEKLDSVKKTIDETKYPIFSKDMRLLVRDLAESVTVKTKKKK